MPFFSLLCYVLVTIIVGFLTAKTSMRTVRNPASVPVWLKWLLFPANTWDGRAPEFIVGGVDFKEDGVLKDDFKARSLRLRYILLTCFLTCLFWPVRIGWILFVLAVQFIPPFSWKVWQICAEGPGKKLFIRLTDLK